MRILRTFSLIAAVATALTMTACDDNDQAEVEIETDTSAAVIDNDVDTMNTGMQTSDTAAWNDNNANNDTSNDAGQAIENAGNSIKAGSIEALVKSQLVVKNGFSDVNVENAGNGRIVLTGTVANDAQKQQAEQVAMTTAGVNSVDNQLKVANP